MERIRYHANTVILFFSEEQGTMTRRFQELLKGLWHALADCNPACETWRVLEESDLVHVQYQFLRIRSGIGILDRFMVGHAQKRTLSD